MDLKKEKEELVELFGTHFERLYNLPPLASRILGTLILDGCRNGITFEELLERHGASKSSVSTSINLLLSLDKITYYTIAGDRKKYFKPAPFSARLLNYQKMIEFEKQLLERITVFRQKTASSSEESCDLQNIIAYQEHILEVEKLLQAAIDKFRETEKFNKFNNQ